MPNIRKYGIAFKTCGVYMITNKVNGKRYVGSSTCIGSRLSAHFGHQTRNPNNKPLHMELNKYGKESFEYCVLEECDKSVKLDREQYWVDTLNPEYNLTYPKTRGFICDERRKRSKHSQKELSLYSRNKILYNTEEYKQLSRDRVRDRMKPVILLDKETEEELMEFESLSATAKWLDENTTFKHISKAGEVKLVCDGKRKSSYGFKYKYKNEEDKYIKKTCFRKNV